MSSGFKSSNLHSEDTFYDSVNDDPLLSHCESNGTKKEETWEADLARLEDEIRTLKSVLSTKERQAAELKRKLGITPIMELKQDITHSIQAIKESDTVQKTNEKLHQFGETIASTGAYQKTNAAFKTFGAFASRKIGDFRNSGAFKSVEDKVGGAYSSVKNQFVSSHSTENFEQSLTSDSAR